MADLPRVIVADPPWPSQVVNKGPLPSAHKHYKLMTTGEIAGFKFDHSPDSLLFLWTLSSMQLEAYFVLNEWGFSAMSEWIWVKMSDKAALQSNFGRYALNCHERCIIAKKGKIGDLLQGTPPRSIFVAPKTEHSRKPDQFYDLVEQVTEKKGPYLELFARRVRPGWQAVGDELDV